jgi:hypothetical protein
MIADVGSDWTNSRLDLILTSGTLYQDPDGSDLHPNPGFFAFVPSLEWDTFLSVPGGYPAPVGIAGDPPYMTDTSITASWFDSVVGTGGLYKIAQITLSSDAAGTVSGKAYDVDSAGMGFEFSFAIPEGDIPTYPIAYSPDYYEIDVGAALALDGSASLFTVTSYEWDLDDDGLFETNAGEAGIYEVGYGYLESLGLGPAAEPYPIHLKVTDVNGYSDTADSALMIVPEPASALVLLVGFACVGRRRMRR